MNNLELIGVPYFKKGSKIHIKESRKGSFTRYCNGKVTQECIDRAKKSKNPKLRKRATFAENVRAWKHQEGGIVEYRDRETPLTASSTSAKLSRDQWEKLYQNGKVGLSEIPRQYQTYIHANNSEFKKGVTNAISDFGTKYVAPALMTTASVMAPGAVGLLTDGAQAVSSLAAGDYANAASNMATDIPGGKLLSKLANIIF